MKQWIEARVVELRRWTDQLYSLRFQAPITPFEAGQFIRLAAEIDGERVARPYSLVNAPDDPVLEVYFIRVPNGPLTEHLVALKPGDPLQVSSRAAGLFTLSQVPDGEDLWMLSTGTALGVFLSLLRTPEPWTRFRRLVLVHAVRTREELTYAETVADLSAAHPEAFRFVPIVSRQEAAFALRGRIPAMIESGELPDHVGLPISPERSQFMLCGNPGMVADTSDTLERMGLRRNRRKEPGQITTEKYW